jgi:hypothetical protein
MSYKDCSGDYGRQRVRLKDVVYDFTEYSRNNIIVAFSKVVEGERTD